MDPVLLARVVAGLRVAFGLALVAVPERLTEPWVGADAKRGGVKVISRALGARDLVLGAGALAVPEDQLQPWLLAAVAADAADLTATLTAGSAIPPRGRVLVSAVALGGAAAGAAALAGVRARSG